MGRQQLSKAQHTPKSDKPYMQFENHESDVRINGGITWSGSMLPCRGDNGVDASKAEGTKVRNGA